MGFLLSHSGPKVQRLRLCGNFSKVTPLVSKSAGFWSVGAYLNFTDKDVFFSVPQSFVLCLLVCFLQTDFWFLCCQTKAMTTQPVHPLI